MKKTLLATTSLLLLAAPAVAQDLSEPTPTPALLCLDDLDAAASLDVARDLAPRARIRAHHESNCLVMVGHPDRVAMVREVLARLEARARERQARD
ncbi:MAG: hypothetical protein KC619_30865 [Myxococcales bacterium]|nr:hypothetical protein [Myxococcales bacterium]